MENDIDCIRLLKFISIIKQQIDDLVDKNCGDKGT